MSENPPILPIPPMPPIPSIKHGVTMSGISILELLQVYNLCDRDANMTKKYLQHHYYHIPRSLIAADVDKLADDIMNSSDDSISDSSAYSDEEREKFWQKRKKVFKDEAKLKENKFSQGFLTPPGRGYRPASHQTMMSPTTTPQRAQRIPRRTTRRRTTPLRTTPGTTLSNYELLTAYNTFNGDLDKMVEHLKSMHPNKSERDIFEGVFTILESRISENLSKNHR